MEGQKLGKEMRRGARGWIGMGRERGRAPQNILQLGWQGTLKAVYGEKRMNECQIGMRLLADCTRKSVKDRLRMLTCTAKLEAQWTVVVRINSMGQQLLLEYKNAVSTGAWNLSC